jgi:Amidohydrolase family
LKEPWLRLAAGSTKAAQMRTGTLLLAVMLAGALASCAPGPTLIRGDLAIVHARLLPMDSVRVLTDHTVVIAGGRIIAVGPSTELRIDPATPTVDAAGGTLMPAFVDSHTHLCDSGDLTTFLTYGVGAVRNMEGTPVLLHLRDAAAAGEIPGPLIRTTGPYTNAPAIIGAEAAMATAEAQAALGYDAIKIHGPMDLETLEVLGRAAEAYGLPIIGHVPRDQDLAAVLATGVMGEISHAEEYLYTLFAHREGAEQDDIIAEAVRLTVAAGVRVTPTLTTYRGIGSQATDVERAIADIPTAHLSPFSVRAFRPRSNRYARRFSADDGVWLAEYLQIQRELVADLAAAGVTILAGTDANSPANVPGDALHREMAELVRSGLSEFQALVAGSRNGWRALTDWDGVVAVGAPAELVLLEADPLADIAATRRIAGLVRNGRWITAELLRQRLDELSRIRAAEQPFVDRLWDNTLEDALPWLEAQRAAGTAPLLRPATLRCQTQRAIWDGVPEVALQALDLIDQPSALDFAYRGEVLLLLGLEAEAATAWHVALEMNPDLQQARRRLDQISPAP